MKRIVSLALVMLMVFGMVACGGSGTTSSTTSAPAGNTSTPSGSTSTPAPAKEYAKEIVVTAAAAAFESVDPQQRSNQHNTRHYLLVYDRLVYLDPMTTELHPMLATEWSVSDDGLTYTFKLREDVTFHNGEKFTADDVVFTWKRGQEATNGTVKNNYLMVADCVAEGDYTVKMTLAAPNAEFVYTRTAPYMAILNREAVEKDPENGVSIGTGLWKWETHESNDYDSFLRNDDYWGETTPTERFVIRHIPETASRMLAIEADEIDLAYAVSTKSIADIEANSKLKLVEHEATAVHFISFNMKKDGPWQDQNFRLAVAHAINWDDVILGWQNGYAVPSTTMWGKQQFGYAAQSGYEFNIAKAKEYLAKTDYKGEEITILTFPSWSSLAVILADMFSQVGINLKVNDVNSTTYSTLAAEGNWDMTSNSLTMGVVGSDFPSFLKRTVGSASIAQAPSKAKIEDLCAQALNEPDDTKRKALYAEVQKLVYEDACLIPVCSAKTFNAIDKNLEGIIWDPSTVYDYRYARIPLN